MFTTSSWQTWNASLRLSKIFGLAGYSLKSCPPRFFFICASTWNGSLCLSSPLTSRPFYPWPSQTEKKWQCFRPMMCGDVM